ncbi:gamma-glutamylcyclotransferase family protein [Aidingimonas halophila]|uniref:Gamma-glutamylcyclotransferase family protein n=1 Tax=Aidingimonas halophila TaxID=574349 RepID=A0A1H2SSG1_9GAMM|nr:gamma-glutamylcyclotransferase family protein [Aidingimonas halophila]GHC17212.1 gamma-glutamylcyclotransferase [Aidingimonas halophila]SDW34576.1 gamma-glutamylaminecyclotransferase [Aidingimonas halophila]
MTYLMFIYGTLKRGFPNHSPYMNRAEFVDVAKTCNAFPLKLHGGRYTPVMIDNRGKGHRVHGELFRVDTATLRELDRFEGVHETDGYRRQRLTVTDGRGNIRTVWGYLKSPVAVSDVKSRAMSIYDDTRYRPRSMLQPHDE